MLNIDCSRTALNSSLWFKESDLDGQDVNIGYFNDNFINKWGDVDGISIHASNIANASISTKLNNKDLLDTDLGTINIEWAIRSDGSASIEIIDKDGKVRCNDIIKKEDGDLKIIKKESKLNYKNNDIIKIKEIDGTGIIYLNSIKLFSNQIIDLPNIKHETQFLDKYLYIIEDICYDLEYIDKVKIQLQKWIDNGINIPEITFQELDLQVDNSKNILEDSLEALLSITNFINNADKHLKSHQELNLNINNSFNNIDKHLEALSIYNIGITNVFHSIDELYKIKKELNQYLKFGADIGNATEKIDIQITNLEDSIFQSTQDIKNIIYKLEEYSKKIDLVRT